MEKVYVVYQGTGDDAYNKVWMGSEYVAAIYASRESAIKHANCWKESFGLYGEWKFDDNFDDNGASQVILSYAFTNYCNGNEYQYTCRIEVEDVLQEFKEL